MLIVCKPNPQLSPRAGAFVDTVGLLGDRATARRRTEENPLGDLDAIPLGIPFEYTRNQVRPSIVNWIYEPPEFLGRAVENLFDYILPKEMLRTGREQPLTEEIGGVDVVILSRDEQVTVGDPSVERLEELVV